MHGTMHSQFIAKLYNHPELKFMIDVFLVPEESYPFALFHYTGSKTFNIRTRSYVKRNGMLLNQYGLYDSQTGKKNKF
jgi:DNA polymerase (family 10)